MMTKPCYLHADNMCCGALRCGEVCMAATSGKWPQVVGGVLGRKELSFHARYRTAK